MVLRREITEANTGVALWSSVLPRLQIDGFYRVRCVLDRAVCLGGTANSGSVIDSGLHLGSG